MNLIFSVFVSRPAPLLPPRRPLHPSLCPLEPTHVAAPAPPRSTSVPSPSPPGPPISILPRSSHDPRIHVPISPPAFSRSGASTYVSSVRIYLSSVVRFRVIKLARAASLGFYLPEKKRINFERRRRFSAGTPFRFVRANERTGRRQEPHPFRYYIFFRGIPRAGRGGAGSKYESTSDSRLTNGEMSIERRRRSNFTETRNYI